MKYAVGIPIMLILLGIVFIILSFKSITNKWAVYTGAILFIITLALFIVTFKGWLFV